MESLKRTYVVVQQVSKHKEVVKKVESIEINRLLTSSTDCVCVYDKGILISYIDWNAHNKSFFFLFFLFPKWEKKKTLRENKTWSTTFVSQLL